MRRGESRQGNTSKILHKSLRQEVQNLHGFYDVACLVRDLCIDATVTVSCLGNKERFYPQWGDWFQNIVDVRKYGTVVIVIQHKNLKSKKSLIGLSNRRFSSFLSPLFQSESKCEAVHMKISSIHTQILVHLHVNKTDFHIKDFALGLALKQRRKATRKSPVIQHLIIIYWNVFFFNFS